MRFAELLNIEARALSEAGADVIQFDEPCFNVYIDKVKDWGMAALERAAEGVTATKAIHICYGYGTAEVLRWKTTNTGLEPLRGNIAAAGEILDRPGSVETAASGVDIAVIEALRGKDVLLGVVDVGTERWKHRKSWPSGCTRRCATLDPEPSLRLHRLRHVAAVAPCGGRQAARARRRGGAGERAYNRG